MEKNNLLLRALEPYSGKTIKLNQFRSPQISASPNGLLIHPGKEKGDLFGRAFFRIADGEKWKHESSEVRFSKQYEEWIHEELTHNSEQGNLHYDDAALQYAAVKVVIDGDKLRLYLEPSEQIPDGMENPVYWMTAPAWDCRFKPMPSRQTGILSSANLHGNQVFTRNMGGKPKERMNVAIYEMGDPHPQKSWEVSKDGFTLGEARITPEEWLKLVVEHPHTLKKLSRTPKEVFEYRTAMLLDVLEEAFEYVKMPFPEDLYAELVQGVGSSYYESPAPTLEVPSLKVPTIVIPTIR